MEVMADLDALQRHVASVTRAGPHYSTNLYASRDQIEKWNAATPLQILQTEGAFLLLRTDRDFRHVYHVANGMDALSAALRRLPPGCYTADLVGQGEPLERLCDAYAAAGFANYGFLRRMNRLAPPHIADDGEVEKAAPGDAPEVAEFLDRLLDRFMEQLPSIVELADAASLGRLLVTRGVDGAISGMLMYDVKGQLAHLRFWHVDTNVRGQGVGRRLMAAFLSRCVSLRRITLWVIGDNSRSISIYRHYGFTEDGLLDRIMITHKDKHR